MVVLALIILGGVSWFYFAYQHQQQSLKDAVARGEYQLPLPGKKTASEEEWRTYYPELIPIVIASTTVQASVADSLPERIKGLSGTPYLPDGIVKLFAFGAEGEHGIWMKDMNYPIDIIWVSKSGVIVHIQKKVTPETYPDSFSSPKPAWYVIEAPAGFTEVNGVSLGDTVIVPSQE